MVERNVHVDSYITATVDFKDQIIALREILLECDVTEEWKWELPAYAYDGTTLIVLQGFKEYRALLFVKGVLLQDPAGVLQKTGENTRVGRQMRFDTFEDIMSKKEIIKAYVQQAIMLEKSGAKVEKPSSAPVQLPAELSEVFEDQPSFRDAWNALTPGKQRGYIFYFNGTKNPETKKNRIEKCIDRIMDGVGVHDRY